MIAFTRRNLTNLPGVERHKELLHCAEMTCVDEIVSGLGIARDIFGVVRKIGEDQWHLEVTLTRKGAVKDKLCRVRSFRCHLASDQNIPIRPDPIGGLVGSERLQPWKHDRRTRRARLVAKPMCKEADLGRTGEVSWWLPLGNSLLQVGVGYHSSGGDMDVPMVVQLYSGSSGR